MTHQSLEWGVGSHNGHNRGGALFCKRHARMGSYRHAVNLVGSEREQIFANAACIKQNLQKQSLLCRESYAWEWEDPGTRSTFFGCRSLLTQ